MVSFLRCLVALCALCLLSACGEEPLPRGVVAQVNGQPISLRTLETLLDTRTAGLGAFEKPSLDSLRKKYGAALSTLIVQVLVVQELERLGAPVADAAVQEVENAIRQDYAENEFEDNLRENAIDLTVWRELLRYRQGMRQFMEQVLRPILAVPLADVEAYYALNKDKFLAPRMLTLSHVVGATATSLETARAKGLASLNDNTTASVYRLRIRRDSIPPAWQKSMRSLKVGEYTSVRAVDGRFEMLLLEEDSPEKKLDIVEAYPYIEQILLEERLDEAFQRWLEKKLQEAEIRVSVHLVREMGQDPS